MCRRWKYSDSEKKWTEGIVRRIVKNEVYIGKLINGTREVLDIGSNKSVYKPKEQRNIIENVHTAIISNEIFLEANNIKPHVSDKPEKRQKGTLDSAIKGVLKCAGCKHILTRRNRKNAAYYCRYYYQHKSSTCLSINVSEKEISDIVLCTLQKQLNIIDGINTINKNKLELYKTINEDINIKQQKLRHERQLLKSRALLSYEKYVEGVIQKKVYLEQKLKNTEKLINIEHELDKLESSKHDTPPINEFMDSFSNRNLESLSKEIVNELISEILVYDNKHIEIVFKFSNTIK